MHLCEMQIRDKCREALPVTVTHIACHRNTHYTTALLTVLHNAQNVVFHYCRSYYTKTGARGGVVVKTLRYKPEGGGFDFR
jgi:hypothetical protein